MDFHQLNLKYIIALIYLLSSCVEAQPSFQRMSDCICTGDIVTYQCTVCGGVATVWEGTAFDCDGSGDEITLTHRNFGMSASFRDCNNGKISGRGLSVVNGCYTSLLNVTFEPTLQDRTVNCSVDDGTYSNEVGHGVLRTSTEPFPAPTVSVQKVNQTEILFSWNQSHNCPSLYNDILSNNCGICPNRTIGTSASCVNFTTSADAKVCEFKLQVVTCGNSNTPNRGNPSAPALVNLTVPRVQQVLSTPHYHLDNGLRSLTTRFAVLAPFVIYEGIYASIESYTVIYSDADSGALCGSQTILANDSHCSVGVCTDEFNVSSSMCPQSTDVGVTVFVTTTLGDGPISDPITEEYQNSYVTVEVVVQTTSIDCTFPEMMTREFAYSCNTTFMYGPNCQTQTNLIGEKISEGLISIGLKSFLEQTRGSRYCGFVVNVTAGEKTLTVEGNLDLITLLNIGNYGVAGAAVGATVIVALTLLGISLVVAFTVFKQRKIVQYEMSTSKTGSRQLTINMPRICRVTNTCNMIEFAKKLHPNYNPDSGTGYFELQHGSPAYISATTEVVLINEDKSEICAGPEARKLVGFHDRRQPILIPESFPWKYVFIQSTSRIRKLPEGTHFIIYPEADDSINYEPQPSTTKEVENDSELKVMDEQYYRLFDVRMECTLHDFIAKKFVSGGNPNVGHFFYEFTEPEFIPHTVQVILMDKSRNIYYGPNARREIGLDPNNYDEAQERKPLGFHEGSRWTKAFIQTRSHRRKLKPKTDFLYCTMPFFGTNFVEVIEPYQIFQVAEEDNDSRKVIKFARERIPDYNPKAGYGYYEFTKSGYILPERNVMALNKNGKLYTGPGVRELIGAPAGYDGTSEVDPPEFNNKNTEWECLFIQVKSFGKKLGRNTRFLYCEYDHNNQHAP